MRRPLLVVLALAATFAAPATASAAITITGGPADGASIRGGSTRYDFTSSVQGTLTCRLWTVGEAVPTATACGGAGVGTSYVLLNGRPEGEHRFAVSDDAGTTWTERTFVLDRVTPTLAVEPVVEDPRPGVAAGVLWTSTPRFRITHSAERELRLTCQLGSRPAAPCAAPDHTEQPIADGTYSFQVRATDAAGNPAYVSTQVVVDTTPPETTLRNVPLSGHAMTSQTITAETNEIGVSTALCDLGAGAYPCSLISNTIETGAPADVTFRIAAVDRAGNVDPTPAEARWSVVRAVWGPSAEPAYTQPPPSLVGVRFPRVVRPASERRRGLRRDLAACARKAAKRRAACRSTARANSRPVLTWKLYRPATFEAEVVRETRRGDVVVGRFAPSAVAVEGQLPFDGSVGGKRLKRGRYVLRVRAVDRAEGRVSRDFRYEFKVL